MRSILLLAICLLCVLLRVDAGETTDVTLDASFSGAWFDPDHEGEGFLLEVLDNNTALTYWFTYDSDGKQLWVVATGTIRGNTIEFVDALAPRGAQFGAGFDPDDVDLGDPWGDFTMTFSGCDDARLDYSSALGDGTQSLTRLTQILGYDCETSSKVFNGSMTGAWFDERRVGEGFLIDVIAPATALIYWFTYDLEGNPFWLQALGTVESNRIVAAESFFSRGPVFGDAFNTDDLELFPFGPLAFAFDGSGDAGAVTFFGPEDFGAGDMQLRRLTTLQETDVTFESATFSIAVDAKAANNVVIDSDVNDPGADFTENNMVAQNLPNPVRVAGYVSAEPAGPDGGRFAEMADDTDAFFMDLAADQAMVLDVASFSSQSSASVDFDLFLLDADSTIVDSSTGLSARESVVTPANGSYFVVVFAVSGAGNYTLATGTAAQAAEATGKMNPRWAMESLEAIIDWQHDDKAHGAKIAMAGGKVLAGNDDDLLLVELPTPKSSAWSRLQRSPWFAKTDFTSAGWQTVAAIKRFASIPGVHHIEPNYIYAAQAEPTDSFYPFQWHYPAINLPQAWDITTGDRDLVVAVLDTGIGAHPDNALNVDFSLGLDAISNPIAALDTDGFDFDANDPGDRANADGSGSYHGTHVAGTIGADTNNGSAAGVAWDVTIMPVRVLGRGGSGSGFDIIQGFRWAAGLSNTSNAVPARRADIINMSLGGPGSSTLFANAIDEARQAGILIVAAAGNNNVADSFFPAAYDGVVSVAATTITDAKAPYSNFGPTIDLAAPGGDTSQDLNGDGYGDGVLSLLFDDLVTPRAPNAVFYNGTSMASPHVAGVMTLMKSVYPDMTPAEFDAALASGDLTSDVLGDGALVRNDTFGFGRIDALAAVRWAQDQAGIEAPSNAVLALGRNQIQFDAMTDSGPLTVSNLGTDPLMVTGVSSNRSWLDIVPEDVNVNGVGRYTVVIDRDDLPTGRFFGQITVTTSAGAAVANVSADVGNIDVPGNPGRVYLLAVDPLTLATLDQRIVTAESTGATFEPLLPGEYLVVGGTDLDNDGFVCDAGELCAAFPDVDEIQSAFIENADLDLGSVRIDTASVFAAQSVTQSNRKGYRRKTGQ